MKFVLRIVSVVLIVAFGATTVARAAEIDAAAKYKLHAVFLYNFISSVEWPKVVYSGEARNIELCIIGKDTMGAVIDAVAKKAEGKGDLKINIHRNIGVSDIGMCNIAYISASEDANAAAIVAKAKENSVLTVSEIKNFANSGGVIEFVLKGASVSFVINNKNARAYGLKVSPQLLEVAAEVVN